MSQRISADWAKKFVSKLYQKYGFSKVDSDEVAKVLISADLHGIRSHGIQRITMYDTFINKNHFIKPGRNWKIIKETPSTATVDGGASLGQLVGQYGMKVAVQKAKKTGIAYVAVKNSNHFGADGYYAELASKQGLIGISSTDTDPLVNPPHAVRPFLGTNPLAFAAPMDNGQSFIFDGATSITSLGHFELIKKLHQQVPGEWAVDEHGKLIKDPDKLIKGRSVNRGLLPLGGIYEHNANYKGFAITLIFEILTALIPHGTISEDMLKKGKHGICHFFIAIDPGAFGNREWFTHHLTNLLDRIHHLPTDNGKPVRIPGDVMRKVYQYNSKHGIEVTDKTLSEMKGLAKKYNVDISFPK